MKEKKQTIVSKIPYALITVYGGVAEIAYTEGKVDVDILDFDNMKDTEPDDLILSSQEWEYLEKHNRELFQFFAPSYAKFRAEC